MQSRKGITLIELLVVIGIMGLLVQMLLPAIQAAREAARKTQCQNNLRQIGLASIQHHDAIGHLPTGGWGWSWVGDPDRGFGRKQPGGWIYNVLPYMEAQDLHDLGKGASPEEKKRLAAELCRTPRTGMNCPSRRDSGPHAIWHHHGHFNAINSDDMPDGHVRSDYAMNGGNVAYLFMKNPIPETLEEGDDPKHEWIKEPANDQAGVVFLRTLVELSQITDGTTHTYLVGEKTIQQNRYTNGQSEGDNLSMYQGFDFDVIRWADPTWPVDTKPNSYDTSSFGSSHPSGFNMVFCDGSVRHLDFDIDFDLHVKLANRGSGEVASTGGLQ